MKPKVKRKSVEEIESFDEFLETLGDEEEEEEVVQRNGTGVGHGEDSEDEGSDEEVDQIDQGGPQEEEDSEDDEEELVQDGEGEESDESGDQEFLEDDEEDVTGSDEGGQEEQSDDEMEVQEEPKVVQKEVKSAAKEHKKSLQKMQESDPEFWAYLKENDKDLLDFDDEDDDDGSESDEGGEVHKPEEDLEVASDSEAEEELAREELAKGVVSKKRGVVSLALIADWESKLTSTKDINVLSTVLEALECGVETVVKGENGQGLKWRVEGSTNFNALVRLCLRHIKEFLIRFLTGSKNTEINMARFDVKPSEIKDKAKGAKWKKVRTRLIQYIPCIISLLQSMGNSDATSSLLRHCSKMAGFWALMGSKSFKLLRTLIGIWCTGEDSCRVSAFLTIIKMANFNRDSFLLRTFKQMYMSYVSNTKFTSVNTWSSINFMRHSLVEVYLLDSNLAYSIAFPFIRQLAIHLRNALTAGSSAQNIKESKKETSRIVYSWQFVHSLHMWVDLLGHGHQTRDGNLKLLIYPVVQLCLGLIKLIPTKKYLPLRFHIIRMLTSLQDKTKVFIPILPLALEVLTMMDFNAKSISKFSLQPLDMTCCLKADPAEAGFAKAAAENAFESILRICSVVGGEIAFPEIVTPALVQLRGFLKHKCKNPEVFKKFKSLIEKIDANSTWVKNKRTKALEAGQVSLNDLKSQQILRIEMENSTPPPPIIAFANEYLKTAAVAQKKLRFKVKETREEEMVPKPGVSNGGSKAKVGVDDQGPLFGDSDEDGEESGGFTTKLDEIEEGDVEEEPKKKKSKKNKRKAEDVESDEPTTNKKMKKVKKNKNKSISREPEPQDELVDFELSD